MEVSLNKAKPLTMHIDMNSSFASVEQQANRMLRGKPVGVAANISPGGCVISPSIEAKARGVKTGFRVRDALEICPDIRIIPSDPDKYFHVHRKFASIFSDYSPHVTALSIDEAVINFQGTETLHGRSLVEIGREIKRRVRTEIGDWLLCNIGIGTNRFLAKTAAGLHKPDGLDVITYENIRDVYSRLELIDLCGINVRNERRLWRNDIWTPIQFLDAPMWKLWKQVFQSVQGYRWYFRLRGYEVDDVSFGRRTFGQGYALHHFTNDTPTLSRLIMKLSEKMGRRLRRSRNYARGVSVFCGYRDRPSWHKGKNFKTVLYSTNDLHAHCMRLMNERPSPGQVTHLGVSCFDLYPISTLPNPLFETEVTRGIKVADSLDECNTKYGEYTVHPASMLGMEKEIIKRVPFHATTDTLAEIYEETPNETIS